MLAQACSRSASYCNHRPVTLHELTRPREQTWSISFISLGGVKPILQSLCLPSDIAFRQVVSDRSYVKASRFKSQKR